VRIETNLVTLNVAVTDRKGNYVRGLTRDYFSITDNGVKQTIDSFSSENSPASIGIVYDMHPSSDEQVSIVLAALKQFSQNLGPQDEFCVYVFGNNGSLTTEFVPTADQVREFVQNGDRKGPTSLYDAIYAASNRVSGMRNPKRLLIILTDGSDNKSTHSVKELRLHLRSINLPVYSVTFGRDNRRMYGYADLYRTGPRQTFSAFETSELDRGVLYEISKTTGGQSFDANVRNRFYLSALCEKVLREVNNQYVIGFYPDAREGKWHKLKISLSGMPSGRHKVTSRRGYQSPATP
jgi:Ca-activated chloride channel family protein